MFRANQFMFALDPNLELNADTLVIPWGTKLLLLIVHFYKYYKFWYQSEIESEKSYAPIWTVFDFLSS